MISMLRRVASALAILTLLAGCVNAQGSFAPIGDGAPPRPADCHVDVYRLPPDRPYTVVSRISVHVDRTSYLSNSLDEPMPELLRQACQSGAEAVTKLAEKIDTHSDTNGYTLTALGIRFTE